MLSDHARSIPIFWGHGSVDALIKYEVCERSVAFLKTECGIKVLGDDDQGDVGVRFRVYEGMEHSSCPEELDHLRSWLKSVVSGEGGRL